MSTILSWLFSMKDVPKLFFPSTVASLTIRAGHKSKDVTKISLQDLVEKRCPSLHNTFTPAWWLPSGHLQTGYCVVGDFSQVDKVEYERYVAGSAVQCSVATVS